MQNLKKFHLLDERVDQTVKKINDLKNMYERLQNENHDLNKKLEALTLKNRELLKHMDEQRNAGTAIDKEEIRKRIDRVLEILARTGYRSVGELSSDLSVSEKDEPTVSPRAWMPVCTLTPIASSSRLTSGNMHHPSLR